MKFATRCPRCGSTIRLESPSMSPVYSCGCRVSNAVSALSLRLAAIEPSKPTVSMIPDYDEWTPSRIACMYYQFREESIEHAKTCELCKAVAEQGFICPDLENLRAGRNKWLALMIAYPQEK